MTLSDLANIGTFVSSIAVLVSLIYLASQVRQAEKNQRAIMNQAVATRGTEIVRWATEPRILAMRTRVLAGETQFTAEEIVLLSFMLRVSLLAAQDSNLQHRQGLTDQTTFENALGGVRGLLAQPVFQAVWRRMRADFAAETALFIDRLIAEAPPAEAPLDIVARFEADLAAVKRR